MAFNSITTTEIAPGAPIDNSLLTKVKDNDDALNAKDSIIDTKDAAQDATLNSLSLMVVPIGAVLPFAGTVAPTNFLFTNGQAVSRTLYPTLFATLGTTWGAGDGSTTFNLPDTRSVFLRGAGTSTGFIQNHTTTFGAKENDAFQGHWHSYYGKNDLGGGEGSNSSGAPNWGPHYNTVRDPSSDGVNGTPRTATETRPMNIGINYIIRAK